MWRAPRVLQSSAQPLHPSPPPPPSPPMQHLPKQNLKFSRRDLAICTNTSLLLLAGSHILDLTCFSHARAEETPENPVTNTEPVQENPPNPVSTIEPQQENPENPVTTIEPQQENPENSVSTIEPQPENPAKNIEPQQENQPEETPKNASICPNQARITKRAFLDISINGKPEGRIIFGLYGESVPVGATRFSKIASGAAGVSYRRKEFIKIMQNYVQHAGVRSYGVDAEMASKTGGDLVNESLVNEWEKVSGECSGTKNVAGSLGIIVRDPLKPPPNIKLVARGGKLVVDEEEVGKEPNGTEFVIATKDSPELDSSVLVVGRVLEGMEVVEKIGQVQTVKDNTTSPYFRVAKLIGDKRAVVAERGFNRPYEKIIVTNCGLME